MTTAEVAPEEFARRVVYTQEAEKRLSRRAGLLIWLAPLPFEVGRDGRN